MKKEREGKEQEPGLDGIKQAQAVEMLQASCNSPCSLHLGSFPGCLIFHPYPLLSPLLMSPTAEGQRSG